MNIVLLRGNITRDPELKYLQSGMAVCNFSIGVNEIYTDKAGQEQKSVIFPKITVWGKSAEYIAETCKKGDAVVVSGSLKSNSWQDKQQQNRTDWFVNAREINKVAKKETASSEEPTAPEKQDDTPF